MKFDVLLMCGGQQTRMGGSSAPPKQLTPINGMPLIERTMRMCKRVGGANTRVLAVANFDAPELGRRNVVRPTQDLFLAEVMCHLPRLRGDAQIVLCGDTVFSYATLEALFEKRLQPYTFATRYVPNIYTGRDCAELYGFTLPNDDARSFLRMYDAQKRTELLNIEQSTTFDPETLRAVRERNFRPWGLMHTLVDQGVAHVHEVAWEDYTDDIDSPEDLETLPLIEQVAEDV